MTLGRLRAIYIEYYRKLQLVEMQRKNDYVMPKTSGYITTQFLYQGSENIMEEGAEKI